MGYTHYWYREKEIDQETMEKIASDFKKTMRILDENGVTLAGGPGSGNPEINSNLICFNGTNQCGHMNDERISVPWPTNTAGGVTNNWQEDSMTGSWFAGALLEKRTCNGDCSYETFLLEKKWEPESWQTPVNNKYFNCCKTAFRPYDIAVTAILIITKFHLEDKIDVSTDGGDAHWFDGKMLCQSVLGYGLEFYIDEGILSSSTKTQEAEHGIHKSGRGEEL